MGLLRIIPGGDLLNERKPFFIPSQSAISPFLMAHFREVKELKSCKLIAFIVHSLSLANAFGTHV